MAELVSIGIATKNRWDDLKNSLLHVAAFGFQDLPVLIYDDHSADPCPFKLPETFTAIEFQVFSESQGYIVRRNQLARAIDTKYYLSLDDDSFPVSGSLQAAVEFAEACDDLFCLSFPIYNPSLGKYQSPSLQDHPYPVKAFVGCGHLLHRERFLALGGYREALIHQGEELDIAARAFQQGWYCYHFPGLEIYHLQSHAGRNWHRMDFYGARNNVLWNDWFVPPELKVVKQSRTFLSRILHALHVRRMGQLQGQLAGFKAIPQYRTHRQIMDIQQFKQWQILPCS